MAAPRKSRPSRNARHDFTEKDRGVRLQKVLADAGVAARRECEKLVIEGAVTVNGHVVDTLPAWVDPMSDRIEVYGRPIRKAEKHVYIALFKPRGTVCTNSDPEGRPRAIDLVRHPLKPRLYCVGRLDIDTSGLLVLTNDGEFANRLTHPRYGVAKGYDLTLDGSLDERAIARIEREILAASRPGEATRSSLRLLNRDREKTVVHLELCEHRNLQIRPLMLELGFPVKKLRRTSFGPLRLKGLAVGEWRELTSKEIEQLRKSSRHEAKGGAIAPRKPKRSMEEMAEAREARAARLATEADPNPSPAADGSGARSAAGQRARGSQGGEPKRGLARTGAEGTRSNRGDASRTPERRSSPKTRGSDRTGLRSGTAKGGARTQQRGRGPSRGRAR